MQSRFGWYNKNQKSISKKESNISSLSFSTENWRLGGGLHKTGERNPGECKKRNARWSVRYEIIFLLRDFIHNLLDIVICKLITIIVRQNKKVVSQLRICRPICIYKWLSWHKRCEICFKKWWRKLSYHIISRLGAAGVQKRCFGHPKIKLFSNVAKCSG